MLNEPLLIIAGLGVVALGVGHVAKRFVPEIVVFLAMGVLIGPEGLGIINARNVRSLDLITEVALGAIIFLIGDRLRLDSLRGMRRILIPVTVGQIGLTMVLVFFATQWAGAHSRLALLLALIAAETGVLTVTATVNSQRAEGRFTDHLLSGVALTNVVTAAMFGLAFPFILASAGLTNSNLQTMGVFAELVLASTFIGLLGGWLLRLVTNSIEASGELLLVVLIVLTGVVGAAIAVDGSVVVSTLVAGLYVANAAPILAGRLFAAVRVLESPIYLVFFVVAGAGVHLDELAGFGAVGAAYLVARLAGKVLGAGIGGLVTGQGIAGAREGLRTGAALVPHAGMAIALVAAVVEKTVSLGESVSGVVLGSIVVFELAGPIFVRRSLKASGEAGVARSSMRASFLPDLDTSRTFERVLVPVGRPDAVLPRLPFLLDIVQNMGAELIAVHVSRPGSDDSDDELPEILDIVRAAATERGVTCHIDHQVSERVSEVLVQAVRMHDADLVIMGEPARMSLLEPMRWGRISQRLIRDADVPVLVYPVDPSNPTEVPAPPRVPGSEG